MSPQGTRSGLCQADPVQESGQAWKGQHIPEVCGNKQITPTVPWGYPFSGALGGAPLAWGTGPESAKPRHLGSDTQRV